MPFIPDKPSTPASGKSSFIPNNQSGFPTQEPAQVHQSLMSKINAGVQGFGNAVGNAGLGVLKGVGHTAATVLSYAGAANSLDPRATIQAGHTIAESPALTPQGTAQKVGFGAEKTAEFLAPGGAESDTIKAADKGIEALNAGKVATGALKVGTRAVTGAATNAGVVAAQGGSGSDVKSAAEVGGVFGAASKPVSDMLNNLPKTAWSNILKRTAKQVEKNPNLPEQAAATGMVGTKGSIIGQSQNAIQTIETHLDDLLTQNASKGTVDGTKVASYLDGLRQTYSSIPGEAHSVAVIDGIQQDLAGKSQLSLKEANQLKRDIYGVVAKSYGKGTLEIPAKIEAQKIAASGLKQEIEKIVPEAKTLNQKQAIYIQVQKAISRQMGEGKGIAGSGIGMYDLLTGGLAESAGLATGHPLLGLGAVATKKAAESAPVLSGVAKMTAYFNTLSPTKKMLFYNGLKGLTTQTINAVKK